MSYPPPPYSGYPPSWHPPSPPHANGHDSLALGTTLGQLLAGQERTIYVLELIHERLVDNSQLMAERLPERTAERPAEPAPATPQAGERMTVRDWVQIGIAVAVVAAAIGGKVPAKDVLPLVLKPFGF